jgi:hypothetical protein
MSENLINESPNTIVLEVSKQIKGDSAHYGVNSLTYLKRLGNLKEPTKLEIIEVLGINLVGMIRNVAHENGDKSGKLFRQIIDKMASEYFDTDNSINEKSISKYGAVLSEKAIED